MGAGAASSVKPADLSNEAEPPEPDARGPPYSQGRRQSLSSVDGGGSPYSPFSPLGRKSRAGGVFKEVSEEQSKYTLKRSDSGSLEIEDSYGIGKPVDDDVVTWFHKRNTDTLQGALAFVPWILQQSHSDGKLKEGQVVIHRGSGAVVFSDASGFTALTERLAKKSNGAELLSQCLTAFFTPLINLINSYRGDVIKFSGDALVIYFPAVDDTAVQRSRLQVPPHGSFGLPDLGPMATAVLRASACCIEIHKRLHMFDTGVDGVCLCLHIGVGCGEVAILQVGGEVPPETHVPRSEYLIAGPPLEQISVAEPLARNGETCVSPQAWEHVSDCVVEDTSRQLDEPDYRLLLRMDETKYTFPTVKFSAMESDRRQETQFRLPDMPIIRRFVPSAVFKQIEGGTLTYVNEMRTISTIFVSGSGVDVSTEEGAQVAQELMASVQQICYAGEGTLNKFVIDDKGMLFLLVYGLPPLVHTDDPTRAVLACVDLVKAFKRLKITGRFGVTTGRAYCGTCGSASRMEYTVLGDAVNLSARLMSNASADGILVDEATKDQCTREVSFTPLERIRVKGKADTIQVFQPYLKVGKARIGIGHDGRIHFPWYVRPYSMSQGSAGRKEAAPPEAMEAQFKVNVAQLCGLSDWEGIKQVTDLLGNRFRESSRARSKNLATSISERRGGRANSKRLDPGVNNQLPTPRGSTNSSYLPTNVRASSKSSSNTPMDTKRAASLATMIAQGVPKDSPFIDGGIIVLEGNVGMGKIELAEEMVMYTHLNLHMLPVFGSIGPRLNDVERLGVELLLSTICAFRHLDRSVPQDPLQALAKLLPSDSDDDQTLHQDIQEALTGGSRVASPEDQRRLLETCIRTVEFLLERLRRRTPLLVVVQLEYGTSLFKKTKDQFSIFWNAVTRLGKLAMPIEGDQGRGNRLTSAGKFHVPEAQMDNSDTSVDNSVVICVLAKDADRSNPAVKACMRRGWLLECNGLSEEMCTEYIATYLGVPQRLLDSQAAPLRDFIGKISLGNPLFIRETIDQLLLHDLVRVQKIRDNEADISYHQDLEGVNIASWYQTSMVGETICLLESLDPLQAAVLKMSTVFTGPFTLPDLASSSCSRWAGAVNFDHLRLFRAVQDLVRRGIIEFGADTLDTAAEEAAGRAQQRFEMRNVLIRKVGGSMLLEAQKKVVKRQALIDRALARDLPARLEDMQLKKLEPHIPWYYESVLAKA